MNNVGNYQLRIDEYIDKCGEWLLRDPNVISVGRGNKIIRGNMTYMPSLTYMVRNKLDKNLLSTTSIISSHINNIITDVVEYGEENMWSNNYYKNEFESNETSGPALGGGKLITDEGGVATLAYAVTDRENHDYIFFLSNSSALADNTGNCLGRKIYYESANQERYLLGNINKTTFLKEGSVDGISKYNEIDAAIGLIGEDNKESRSVILPGLIDKTVVKGYADDVQPGELVYKIGHRTGKTLGKVILVNGIKKEKNYFYKNQISVLMYARKEDAGALGIRENDNKVFGMLMSRDARYATFNSMKTILDTFQLDFLQDEISTYKHISEYLNN